MNNKTKTLSQQLAEIAEIPPTYTIVINMGDLDYNFQKFSYKSKFTLLRTHLDDLVKSKEDKGIYTTWVGDIKEEFPDFESDTDEARYNFCRLMDEYFKTYELIKARSKKDILLSIIKSISTNCGFKQALQNTQWRY